MRWITNSQPICPSPCKLSVFSQREAVTLSLHSAWSYLTQHLSLSSLLVFYFVAMSHSGLQLQALGHGRSFLSCSAWDRALQHCDELGDHLLLLPTPEMRWLSGFQCSLFCMTRSSCSWASVKCTRRWTVSCLLVSVSAFLQEKQVWHGLSGALSRPLHGSPLFHVLVVKTANLLILSKDLHKAHKQNHRPTSTKVKQFELDSFPQVWDSKQGVRNTCKSPGSWLPFCQFPPPFMSVLPRIPWTEEPLLQITVQGVAESQDSTEAT